MEFAKLTRYGLLSVMGEEARDFLHAQLTNDIKNLPDGRAALAGWCSAQGRLLASLLVIPCQGGFLLQLARDLAPKVAKRLSMFVLRAKVKVADDSERWSQAGIWGELPGVAVPAEPWSVVRGDALSAVRVAPDRVLVLGTSLPALDGSEIEETRWSLEEIRAGRPLITSATQELFVPQMVNLHTLGGVDFKKGCYPGQEIVARAQYRGQVKRRMIHAHAPSGAALAPGQPFQDGTVVDAAATGDAVELLAVVPIAKE